MKHASRKAMALTAGILCHGSFLLAVTWMGASLFAGMRFGLGRLTGARAWAANALLIAQFPLLHSSLLTRAGMRALARLGPRRLGRVLSPTTFATIASWQVLATFALWSPTGDVWWRPTGESLVLGSLAFALAWVFLAAALRHAGLGLQTGWIGWTAAWEDRPLAFGGMPTQGLFRVCRQPIYLGFALTLWTGPVWTLDHLAIALAWTAYCLLGPLHKERRFERLYGAAFAEYRARVPYILPRIPT